MIARRASLEDDLSTIAAVESLRADVIDEERDQQVRVVIARLAALATGRLQIMREMRELDDRLGLTPKGLAQLRWTIVAGQKDAAPSSTPVSELDERRARLRADAS